MKTATINEVSTEPKVTPEKEKMVTILIDPQMVGKTGIRINGKMYIGKVTVPESQADDLLRIQEEYWETVKKLKDPQVTVRMKSDFQKEKLFLADPDENARKATFTRDYGLLGAKEWSYCSETFKKHLLDMRKQLYGY